MGTPLVPEVSPAVLIRVSSGADSQYLAVLMRANTHKVFGHSLAKADYAYFQAIFDIVDIYIQVQLNWCFSTNPIAKLLASSCSLIYQGCSTRTAHQWTTGITGRI